MKIISIGFNNPFYESGYSNDLIKINDLNDINVLIGKNNSGKTNVLRNLYNLLHQPIERSGIFRRITVKLTNKDFQLIIKLFYEILVDENKKRNLGNFGKQIIPLSRYSGKDILYNFNSFFNLVNDYPISDKCSFIFNFNNDIINSRLLFDCTVENIGNLNESVQNQFEKILENIRDEQNLIKILLRLIIPIRRVIFIPSFRTLEISEKIYRDTEIKEINASINTILEKSFDCIPLDNPRNEPFKIPNLALILSMAQRDQLSGKNKELLNTNFFHFFNSSLKQIFPEIDISINFEISELKTKGGYQEYGKFSGDWRKLGQGTQQLISLLFLLILPKDCVYIIDEPENSLHPGLQLKLLNFIKEIVLKDTTYSKQFFISTHSTSFIDFKGTCSHFICEKTEDKFSVVHLDEENLNIVRDVLGLNPGTLLQSTGIIWVEGPSERFYLKMLFQCFDVNLDEKGVLIMPYNGKDYIIKEYISLDILLKINPNFAVIMDSDKKGPEKGLGIDQSRHNISEKYLAARKKFWLIGKYCDIEGIIPQEVLNEYFKIKLPLPNDKLKGNYQKLDDYIDDLKHQGLTAEDSPNYRENKVRDSENISNLILANENYKQLIRENQYLRERITELSNEIKKWIENPSIKMNRNEIIDSSSLELEMKDALARYSNFDQPEVRRQIVANFISWGTTGTQFLLDEYKTNKYGYSNTSGAVMDLTYPNWREEI